MRVQVLDYTLHALWNGSLGTHSPALFLAHLVRDDVGF